MNIYGDQDIFTVCFYNLAVVRLVCDDHVFL